VRATISAIGRNSQMQLTMGNCASNWENCRKVMSLHTPLASCLIMLDMASWKCCWVKTSIGRNVRREASRMDALMGL